MPGIIIDIDPVALRIGSFALRWYGLAVVAAVVVGFSLGLREAQRRGLDVDRVHSLGLWALVAAVLGARLAHVIDHWDFYLAHPAGIFALREGGLSIYGAMLGGLIAGALYARRAKLPLLVVSDAAAPALILAQAVGRLGCIVNGDSQGLPADLPWAFTYVHPDALAPELGVPGHPYPLYEIIWDLAVFALLWRMRGRALAPGVMFFVYAGLYSLGRLALTFVRGEAQGLFGLQQAQVIALATIILAVPAIVYLSRRAGTSTPTAVGKTAGQETRAGGASA